MPEYHAVHAFVIESLEQRAAELGFADLEVDGTFDFFESGLLDSLGLIALIDSVEAQFGLEVDLTEMDPDSFTTVDGVVSALLGDLP